MNRSNHSARVSFAATPSYHEDGRRSAAEEAEEDGPVLEEDWEQDQQQPGASYQPPLARLHPQHPADNNNAHHAAEEGLDEPTASANAAVPQQHPSRTAAARTPNLHNNNNGMFCPNCGGREIEQHEASGASICTDCGVVVEENAIVSSVEFVEGAGGSSSMVGQFVSATSSKAYGTSGGAGRGGGGRYGYSRDSRETTLANGRRRIQELAARLRLGSTFIDGAHRLFAVAVERNFVQGRRTTHVVASCLYMACRQLKSQHMLIDFSDALQVNVYTLGTVFLKFRRLLGLQLELIDPALYIYRFAAHLDLAQHQTAVSLTALRLVARMKRDWIVTGRRPAGICAAALLIAARAHGLDKRAADVTRILQVCGVTVTRRLQEFAQTPTSQLALEQFHGSTNSSNTTTTATTTTAATSNTNAPLVVAAVDFVQECDPPIYTRNKRLEARAKAIQQGNVALLTSGALDEEGKHGAKWRNTTKISERNAKFQEMYESLERELMNEDGGSTSPSDKTDEKESKPNEEEEEEEEEEDDTGDDPVNEDDESNVKNRATTENNDDDDEEEQTTDAAIEVAVKEAVQAKKNQSAQEQQQLVVPANSTVTIAEDWKKAYPQSRGRDLILPDEATEEEQLPPQAPVECQLCLEDWKQEMPASIDEEIEDMFRSEEEEKQKEAIFNKMNQEYLQQQERKERERVAAELAQEQRDEDEVAQAAGQARLYSKKRKGVGSQQAHLQQQYATTEEALRAAVASRKVSRKINYDALTSIFDDEGSFASGNGVTDDGIGEEEMLFDVI